jgi:cytosine deaminase
MRSHFTLHKNRVNLKVEGGWVMDEFMQAAIAQAEQGFSEGGIPIGSVLVKDGQILGRGHNKRVQDNDPMTHAEIDCLRNAGRIGNYRGTTLYSTLMPCYLCAGAVVQFGIKKVIAGESITFPGAKEFMESHGVEVVDLDLDECKQLMRKFIQKHPQLWNEDIGR